MNTKYRQVLLFICLLSLLTAGCASSPGKMSIHGMVYDCNNQPAGNYEIFIDDVPSGITDIGGRFDLSVKPGTHQLTGGGIGYSNIHTTASIYDAKQTVYLRVETVDSVLAKATVELESGRADKAVTLLKNCLPANRDNKTVVYILTTGYLLSGERTKASETFKILEQLVTSEDRDAEFLLLEAAVNR